MSKPREENPELARVLSRVNALMKHEEVVTEVFTESAQDEPELPVLTEVYEGEPLDFAPRHPKEVGVQALATEVAKPSEEELQAEDRVEAILAQLMPLIHSEVKKAVRQELINMEKIVNHRLETEFIQTLLQRLRAEAD
ncbi:MAG TPA: hypothetical protein VFS17_07355 [Methylophilaceae bacterium]|nr:hypothetical protein [Methylophilaceae bacterium]